MQHLQGIRWSGQPLAWPKRLCSCAHILDAQTPINQANKKSKIWPQSTNTSTDSTQEKAVDMSQSAKARWGSRIKPTSAENLPVQQTRSLSTKVSTCAMPTSIKLVDVTLQGIGNENVQSNLMLSTTKLKAYQQIPSKGPKRTLSTGSSKQNDQPSNGSSGVVDQQLTDQQVDSDTINSTNTSTETPQNQHNATSTGDKSRSPTPQPPDPETCCESGCANCVWIRYVQEMQQHTPLDKEQATKVLDLIEDHNVKMFVKMELGL